MGFFYGCPEMGGLPAITELSFQFLSRSAWMGVLRALVCHFLGTYYRPGHPAGPGDGGQSRTRPPNQRSWPCPAAVKAARG